MRAAERFLTQDRVVKLVHGPSVKSDAHTERFWQSEALPVEGSNELSQLQRKVRSFLWGSKNKEDAIAPGVFCCDIARRRTEPCDPTEDVFHKHRNLRLGQFTEADGIGEQQRHHLRHTITTAGPPSLNCMARTRALYLPIGAIDLHRINHFDSNPTLA